MRVFAAPHRYVQGPGVLDLLPGIVSEHGRPLVVMDPFVRELLGPRMAALLPGAEIRLLAGEITAAAADWLAKGAEGTAVVVGVGGGKSLDAAKAVALRLSVPVVTVPSVASNDSPTSGAIAMYDDEHRLVGLDHLPRNPDVVLVDTTLVAAAPTTFLRAGIGDAVAKRFEAAGCAAGTGLTPLGTRPLLTGGAVADACYATLRRSAVAALAACERGEVDQELEDVVEAVVLMSGLGFENGGLSLAHSLTRGLMVSRGAGEAMHGFHVAWGLLVQLVVEGRSPDEVDDVRAFLRSTGLPTSLAELGMPDPTREELRTIASRTMTAPHLSNLSVGLTEESLCEAFEALEAIEPLNR